MSGDKDSISIFSFNGIHPRSRQETVFTYGALRRLNEITVFLVDDDSHQYFVDFAATVLLKALGHFGLESELQKFKWVFIAGAGYSEIYIESKKGIATSLSFENTAVLEPFCCAYSVKQYTAALTSTRGVRLALLESYSENVWPSFHLNPVKFYLAHTPNHPATPVHIMEHPYPNLDSDHEEIVLADAKKFMNYWRSQCGLHSVYYQFFGPLKLTSLHGLDKDDWLLLNSPSVDSLGYIIPRVMSEGVSFRANGKIRFTNGRHRAVNIANLGAPFIPIHVNRECLQDFKATFEF